MVQPERKNLLVRVVVVALMASLVALVGIARSEPASAEPPGGQFVPIAPFRLVDIATGVGGSTTRIGPQESRDYQILGIGGVPATDVSAVVVDVAASSLLNATTSSLRVYASGGPTPDTVLRVEGGTVNRSNTVITKVGVNGKIRVYNANGDMSFNLDVQGYFTTSGDGAGFTPINPVRMVSTSTGVGIAQQKVAPNSTQDLQIAGGSEVPLEATAIYANVKVSGASANGSLRLGEGGASSSGPASLNYAADVYSDSGMTIKLAPNGKIRLTNLSTVTSIDFHIDVQGYFVDGPQFDGGGFTPLSGLRIYGTQDTAFASGEVRTLTVSGLGGLPAAGQASAAVLTVAATDFSASGAIKVWSADATEPGTTSLTFNTNSHVTLGLSSTSIVRLPANGAVKVKNTSAASVRAYLSAQGWFDKLTARAFPQVPRDLAVTPSRGTTTATSTPELRARLDDPDSAELSANFRIYDSDDAVVAELSADTVQSGGTASVEVPEDLLLANRSYSFDVRADDGQLQSAYTPRRAFTFNPALTVVPAPACDTGCVAIADQELFNGTVPAGADQLIAVAIPGADPGTIDRVQVTARVRDWTSAGSITLADPDFTEIEPSSIAYGSGPTGQAVLGTAEVFLSYENDQIVLVNNSQSSISVELHATAWLPVAYVPDPQDPDAEDGPVDDLAAETLFESYDEPYDDVEGDFEVVEGSKRDPSMQALAQAAPVYTPHQEDYACPDEDDPDATCTLTYTPGDPTAEEMSIAAEELSDPPVSQITGRPDVRASRALADGCKTKYGRWVFSNRFSGCYTIKMNMVWRQISRSGIRVTGRAVIVYQYLIVLDWDSAKIESYFRATWISGVGDGGMVYIPYSLRCPFSCTTDLGLMTATENLSGLDRTSRWGPADFTANIGPGEVRAPQLMVTAAICSRIKQGARCQTEPPFRTIQTGAALIRCDQIKYLQVGGPGCVMRRQRPTLLMSLSGRAPETTRHIRDAQARIAGHPGRRNANGSGMPLVRQKWPKGRNPNTKEKDRICRKLKGPGDCDEYPFGTTRQGCYFLACSVRKVPSDDNQLGGSELSTFLRTMRVLSGDPYWVRIVP